MRKRIFYAISVALLFAMIVTTAIGIAIFYKEYEKRLNEDLNIGLNFLSYVAEENPKALEDIKLSDRRITYIASDGDVIYDSMTDESRLENHLDRKEVRDAFSSGAGYDTRSSSSIGQKYIYQAILLHSGNVLRLSAPVNTITYFVISILLPLSICLLVLLFFSILLASFIAHKITTPINSLDLDNPENVVGYPELTPLLVRISHQQNIIKSQLEEARQKAKEFTLITDNMQEGLVVLDSSARILSVNNATKRLFYNNQIKDGDSILQLSRSVSFTSIVKASLSGKADSIHLELGGRTLEIIANPVSNDVHHAGAVLIFIDITEKEKRETLRREFTANVSHELKTPLTVISGFAELMKDNNLNESAVKDYSLEIYNQAQRLISLVHDIIKLSELDEKKGSDNKESVRLSDIVERVVKSLDIKAKSADISISVNINNEKNIFGNEALLEELTYNLIDNSIRYNKKGGSVAIAISSDEKNLSLSVSDTGIGIPDEDKERVFERFYRVDKGRSRESGGTGLGLSIVKHVVEHHHGVISLDSKLGEGTVIKVTFPLEK